MLKFGLKLEDIDWIEGTLSNDENSTDEELVAYFRSNGLTAEQAEAVVACRLDYLSDIIFNGQGALWEDT